MAPRRLKQTLNSGLSSVGSAAGTSQIDHDQAAEVLRTLIKRINADE